MPIALPSRRLLTLEAARVAMSAAQALASENGWAVVIAIIDDGGHLVALERCDGTQWSSIDTAIGKARAAVGFMRPSRLLEEAVNGGRTAHLTIAEGMAMLQGGVPIEIDGHLIGAVGVSGVKAPDDERIAIAGVEAIRAAVA